MSKIFEKYSDQLQKTTSNNVIKRYTGLSPFRVVAVNPNKTELETILGRELNYTPDYSKKENSYLEIDERPITLWLENISEGYFVPMTINISNKHITTKAKDKFKFINSKGQISYFAKDEESITQNTSVTNWYSPKGLRKLYRGEDILYYFLQKLIRFDNRSEEASWLEMMSDAKISAEELYSGDYSGLRDLISYANDNNNQIILLNTVKEVENENGTKYIQIVLPDPNTFFSTTSNSVDDYHIDRLKEYSELQEKNGYPITKNYFTYKFKEFDKNDFISDAPVESVVQSEDDDWPF